MIHNLFKKFENILKQHGEEDAIVFRDRAFSYNDLNLRSIELAKIIQAHKLHPGSVVAIASTKSFDDFALMLACLRIGVIYTNIDIFNPVNRLRNIFETCKPSLVFSSYLDDKLKKISSELGSTFLVYSETTVLHDHILESQDVDGSAIAYIMFTSGSTGKPKGVAITHQNILYFSAWIKERFSITPRDNFAGLSPMYFDNSVFDFYGSLFNGATLTPITKELLESQLELVTFIAEKQCTIWFSVPSLLIYLMTMKALKAVKLQSIRVFSFGGEGYPKKELKKLYDIYNEQALFINVYGPTECTCICSSYIINDTDFENLDGFPPLGNLNPNYDHIISNRNEVTGVGELWLMGPLIGAGYYNDLEKSRDSFIFYMGEEKFRKPTYKTGDLVREEGDKLWFVGRVDNQIKRMGYRIELEEIEHALLKLKNITRSSVAYIVDEMGYGKIKAFVLVDEYERAKYNSLEEDIEIHLRKNLPCYMVPDSINIMPKFFYTQNGKVDKKRLLEL